MPKRRPPGKNIFKKLDVSKLKKAEIAAVLPSGLDRKLESLQLGCSRVEDDWAILKEMIYTTAFVHLGPAKRKKQD